jgi:hypothetical protein
VNPEAQKYRRAAAVALSHAHRAKNETVKASWLKYHEEWTRLAEEIERAEQTKPKEE